MRILITGVGGPTPRSFAIALKKYGIKDSYQLLGTDTNPLSIGLYQPALFDKTFVIPTASDPNYWDVIERIVREHAIEYAIVLPELEVIEWSKRAKVKLLPCAALIPEFELASLLVDKARMTSVLSSVGLVPKSVEFSRDRLNLTELFKSLPFPFWVRSSSGTSGLGSLKILNEDALRNWVLINPGVDTFLASEFLPGRNLACKLLYFGGKLVRAACAERVNYIMAKVAPSGITGNTSFGRLLNEPQLVSVAEKAMDYLFKETGAAKHGFFTVDFKEDATGKPMITEINVRHVAFTQCFAAAGANFAEDTIRLLSGDSTFDTNYFQYVFSDGLIFLRDVDCNPILMLEKDLLINSKY
jgi:hypothetical protein